MESLQFLEQQSSTENQSSLSSNSADLLPEACRSLFLGDLSCFCQEVDIFRVFSQFGSIEEIRLKRDGEGNGLGYGFITFIEMKSAEAALEADGLLILGRPVKISWANVRSASGGKVSLNADIIPKPKNKVITADTARSAQIHFSFISKQQVQLVTEETVRKVFMNFGHVLDVTIKKTSTNPKTGEQTGYGFVHFPLTDTGIQSAISAAKVIRQVYINNVLYDCRLTWSLEEIIRRKQLSRSNSLSPPRRPIGMPPRATLSLDDPQYLFDDLEPAELAPPSSPVITPPPSSSNFSCFQPETTTTFPPMHVSPLKLMKSRRPGFEPEISLSSLSSSSFSSSSQMSGFFPDSVSHLSISRMQQQNFSQSFSFDEETEEEDPFIAAGLRSSSLSSASQGKISITTPNYVQSHQTSPVKVEK